MKNYILISVILVVLSFIYLKLAVKYRIIDKPNERSSHTKVTVRGGGIIFPIAILLFFFFNDYQYPYFVLGIFLISVVSFLDDIYTLSSKVRFPFQFLVVFLILYQVGFPLSPLYLTVLYVVIGIGIINMLNFMDGINGITGIYSLAVLSGLFFINVNEHLLNEDLIIFTAISLLIFGFYNFRKKALFFAGDIGSIAIGVLIFFIGFLFTIKLSSPLILLVVIVYGADTGCTFLYRKLFTNESVFDPHRHHIYQKLVDVKKMSHIKVSIMYAIVQLLMNFVLYNTYQLELQTQLLILIVVITVFMLMYLLLFHKLKVRS
jgi:UDP-N-acetylmuramyl pentapeptide phosphotransferase/UDP-N-acetylglucosamine-1-phosphate transferase